MSEPGDVEASVEWEEAEQYQPPPPRSIDQLLGADQGDEALRRWPFNPPTPLISLDLPSLT